MIQIIMAKKASAKEQAYFFYSAVKIPYLHVRVFFRGRVHLHILFISKINEKKKKEKRKYLKLFGVFLSLICVRNKLLKVILGKKYTGIS